MARFTNKTIVVTGGAGGLGNAIVRAFAAEDGRVVVADIGGGPGTALAAQIGPLARFIPLDVADETAWEALLDIVDNELGGLDVLVNNAGIFRPNIPFEDMPLTVWREHFSVNCDGTFLGCKHAIRRMKARGGAIVNIGSGMSITANPTASAYCATKAAVLMTTRTAAAAAGRYGIRVNAVLPGAVSTRMLMGNLLPGEAPEPFLERLAAGGALGRLATAEDIAGGVLFLADPANAAISGAAIPIDGGSFPGG